MGWGGILMASYMDLNCQEGALWGSLTWNAFAFYMLVNVSHGNTVNSHHQWEFRFNSHVWSESTSNSHRVCELNYKLIWINNFASRTLVTHWIWHFMRRVLWTTINRVYNDQNVRLYSNMSECIHITDVNLVLIPISDVK